MQVLHDHFEWICSDLQNHVCTDVQTNERVSVLMKESFACAPKFVSSEERKFMKEFVDTQMFTVYSDCIIK